MNVRQLVSAIDAVKAASTTLERLVPDFCQVHADLEKASAVRGQATTELERYNAERAVEEHLASLATLTSQLGEAASEVQTQVLRADAAIS